MQTAARAAAKPYQALSRRRPSRRRDEPTSGLDARAAAIVMRAVKNVSLSNRTVMVTIHQVRFAVLCCPEMNGALL